MVEKKRKADAAYVVKPTSDAPGGDCKSKTCGIKSIISNGMTIVKCEGKTYHASCAIREGIAFKVPVVPRIKKVE